MSKMVNNPLVIWISTAAFHQFSTQFMWPEPNSWTKCMANVLTTFSKIIRIYSLSLEYTQHTQTNWVFIFLILFYLGTQRPACNWILLIFASFMCKSDIVSIINARLFCGHLTHNTDALLNLPTLAYLHTKLNQNTRGILMLG